MFPTLCDPVGFELMPESETEEIAPVEVREADEPMPLREKLPLMRLTLLSVPPGASFVVLCFTSPMVTLPLEFT